MPAPLSAVRPALLAWLLAGPAAAQVAPGPPPWSCSVAAACDARGCISIPSMLASVTVEAGDGPETLRLGGRTVGHYPGLEAARAAVAAGTLPPDAGLVLVRDAFDPADAIGFSVYAQTWRNGRPGLGDGYASLICN